MHVDGARFRIIGTKRIGIDARRVALGGNIVQECATRVDTAKKVVPSLPCLWIRAREQKWNPISRGNHRAGAVLVPREARELVEHLGVVGIDSLGLERVNGIDDKHDNVLVL